MTDALVVGAGPAGSCCANLLAQHGRSVRLVDKEQFPRFHIGESLLPRGIEVYKRLKLDLDDKHLLKQGAEFIDDRTGECAVFNFANALPGCAPHAYQVDRATFDHDMLSAAERAGAIVHQGVTVNGIAVEDECVNVETTHGTFRTRYLIDATGQDALMCRTHRSRDSILGFGKAAVFCHFRGLRRESVDELAQTGNIKVLMLDRGWSWLIPLRDGSLSVGLVSLNTPMQAAWLDELIASSPTIQRLTAGAASRTEARIISNFSYKNTAAHGKRWTCIGDAACFLDPVFSSGVSLAVLGGERAADLLNDALANNNEGDVDVMAPLHSHMAHAYEAIGALVHSFYHTRIVHNLFFTPRPDPKLVAGITSLLALDVWRTDNRFQDMLLRSTRRMNAGRATTSS